MDQFFTEPMGEKKISAVMHGFLSEESILLLEKRNIELVAQLYGYFLASCKNHIKFKSSMENIGLLNQQEILSVFEILKRYSENLL